MVVVHSRYHKTQGDQAPNTDQIRAEFLTRVVPPAAGLRLEYKGCTQPPEQLAFRHKFVAFVLLRFHLLGAGGLPCTPCRAN